MKIKKAVSGIMHTNSYLVWDEITKKGVVIDSGSNIKELVNVIREENLIIEYILNTHYHADHTGSNRKLKKLTNGKILIQKEDAPFLRQIINGSKLFTFNLSLSPIPDMIIDCEMTLLVGNLEIIILHTPGHTPGGLCFYINKVLFTGDTLFVGDSGTTRLKGGHRPTLGKSLRRIMNELPGDTVIYPGHDYGPTATSTLDWEKRNNINAKEYGYFE